MAPGGFPAGQRVRSITFTNETDIAWCNLPDDEMIVVLTPVLPQPNSNGTELEGDPFEGLARAIGSLHRGLIRHVPYVPKTGLTDFEIGFLDSTATVLAVVAEPVNLQGRNRQSAIDWQTEFVRAAVAKYNEIHEGTEPTAFIMLYCGVEAYAPPSTIEMCWQIDDYTGRDWSAVAARLIQGHEV